VSYIARPWNGFEGVSATGFIGLQIVGTEMFKNLKINTRYNLYIALYFFSVVFFGYLMVLLNSPVMILPVLLCFVFSTCAVMRLRCPNCNMFVGAVEVKVSLFKIPFWSPWAGVKCRRCSEKY